MAGLTNEWRKSNRSGPSGDCVEVRRTSDAIEVRDSKDCNGPRLRFSPAEWDAFLAGLKDGNDTL